MGLSLTKINKKEDRFCPKKLIIKQLNHRKTLWFLKIIILRWMNQMHHHKNNQELVYKINK